MMLPIQTVKHTHLQHIYKLTEAVVRIASSIYYQTKWEESGIDDNVNPEIGNFRIMHWRMTIQRAFVSISRAKTTVPLLIVLQF